MMSPKNLHSVKFVIADPMESEARLVFECAGDKDSSCHQYPACDCEGWNDSHAEEYGAGHETVAHKHCWMQDWFADGGAAYGGSDGDLAKQGPIDAWFDGDGLIWEYMPAEAQA